MGGSGNMVERCGALKIIALWCFLNISLALGKWGLKSRGAIILSLFLPKLAKACKLNSSELGFIFTVRA